MLSIEVSCVTLRELITETYIHVNVNVFTKMKSNLKNSTPRKKQSKNRKKRRNKEGKKNSARNRKHAINGAEFGVKLVFSIFLRFYFKC